MSDERKMRDGVRQAERDLQKSMDDALRDAQRAQPNQRPVGAGGRDGDIRLHPRKTPRR